MTWRLLAGLQAINVEPGPRTCLGSRNSPDQPADGIGDCWGAIVFVREDDSYVQMSEQMLPICTSHRQTSGSFRVGSGCWTRRDGRRKHRPVCLFLLVDPGTRGGGAGPCRELGGSERRQRGRTASALTTESGIHIPHLSGLGVRGVFAKTSVLCGGSSCSPENRVLGIREERPDCEQSYRTRAARASAGRALGGVGPR